jgi:hypothetical protein
MISRKASISAINKTGALLVFPLNNRPEPASIWSQFYPKDKMLWEWDENGDDRVSDLWYLKTELSTTRKVVYTKWYQGRATYFSRPLFTAMLRGLNSKKQPLEQLSQEARRILQILNGESPLSTKELKRISGLQGRGQERNYTKALNELWSRLLIVGFGEVDDGAFPSLAVGATQALFEDLWRDAFAFTMEEANLQVHKALPSSNLFLKYYLKLQTKFSQPQNLLQKSKPKSKKENHKNPKKSPFIRFEDL